MSGDFDWKEFGRDFVQKPVMALKRKLQILVENTGMLKPTFEKLIKQIPEGTKNIKITVEYMATETRGLSFYQRQIVPVQITKALPTEVTKQIKQQPTDPTRTLITWREFSDKVGERIDQLALTTITTIKDLDAELEIMLNEIMEIFEDYLWLMMMKGITFATEHMNVLSPNYHFTAGWQPSDDKLLADLITGCRDYMTNWTSDLRKDAAEEIDAGIKAGETAQQIGVRIADTIQANRNRGTLIARTELMRAWNRAAYDRYLKAGFGIEGTVPPAHPNGRCGINVKATENGYRIVWMTARDPVVCEICEPLDGVPINEIDENFHRTVSPESQ